MGRLLSDCRLSHRRCSCLADDPPQNGAVTWQFSDEPRRAVRQCSQALEVADRVRLEQDARSASRHNRVVRVPVWVDHWQLQCCGEPFNVGSTVEWTLTIEQYGYGEAMGAQAPKWAVTVPVLSPATGGVVVGVGGLCVYVSDGSSLFPTGSGETVRLGLLREDHHIDVPGDVMPTRGLVAQIQVVRLGYDPHTGLPVPGEAALNDVHRADKWPTQRPEEWAFAGYLVHLDVEDLTELPADGIREMKSPVVPQ